MKNEITSVRRRVEEVVKRHQHALTQLDAASQLPNEQLAHTRYLVDRKENQIIKRGRHLLGLQDAIPGSNDDAVSEVTRTKEWENGVTARFSTESGSRTTQRTEIDYPPGMVPTEPTSTKGAMHSISPEVFQPTTLDTVLGQSMQVFPGEPGEQIIKQASPHQTAPTIHLYDDGSSMVTNNRRGYERSTYQGEQLTSISRENEEGSTSLTIHSDRSARVVIVRGRPI